MSAATTGKGAAIIAVKPNSTAIEAAPAAGAVEKVEVTLSDLATAAPITDRQPKAKSGRPELTEAQIVVSGGRGTGGDFSPVEAFADAGFLLGHAGIVAIPEHLPLAELLAHLFAFTARESCGKCFPCRIGSRRDALWRQVHT